MNLINKKDNKWFQHSVTVELHPEKIAKITEKITKIKRFINKYN